MCRFPSFAAKYAAERLAIIDRDVDRLVELVGGDLSSPHQSSTRVAEAMVELGEIDDALTWARRGITETTGWQVAKLYDLAADLLTDEGDMGEVVALRRHHQARQGRVRAIGVRPCVLTDVAGSTGRGDRSLVHLAG